MEYENLKKLIQNNLSKRLCRFIRDSGLDYDELQLLVYFIEQISFGLEDSLSKNNTEPNKTLKAMWNAFDEVYNEVLNEIEM